MERGHAPQRPFAVGWNHELKRLIAATAATDPELAEQMTARLTLHGDASFEFGLACLVDGIATRVPTRG